MINPRIERQLKSRALFGGRGHYGIALAPVAALFTWMLLVGWDTNTLPQQVFIGAFVAFMWLLVLALLVPRRVRWAPRVVTGTVGILYVWYLVSEGLLALRTRSLSGSSPGTTLPMALLGFVVIGAPCLYFAWHGRFRWTSDEEADAQPPSSA